MNLRLFRSAVLGSRRKWVTIRENHLGRIGISLYTLESLAKRKVMEFPEIMDASVKAVRVPAGVTVRVELSISLKDKLPSLTQRVQTSVKKEIISLTDIQLQNVHVTFGKVISDKPRVR